ncbi:MAG: hypothetical protein ACYSYU_04260 [Planctomycetota bacterium]
MMIEKNILIVDDDRIILDSLCEFLAAEGFQTKGAQTLKIALAELQKQSYALVCKSKAMPWS